jgi:hypothetical protein
MFPVVKTLEPRMRTTAARSAANTLRKFEEGKAPFAAVVAALIAPFHSTPADKARG